jgi:hypothetical protein
MEWVKERDLLIAQTLAFVQSVTGNRLEAEAYSAAAESKARIAAAPIDATRIVGPPESIPVPRAESLPAPRTAFAEDLRAEMQSRVARFRAHQERFTREREAYCSATLAKARAGTGDAATAPSSK